MLLQELFFQIGIVFVIAAVASMIVYRFKFPLIVAYVITGVIAGAGLNAITKSSEVFEVMSQIGIAFLLFTVGLGLNWRNIKEVGGVSLATGVGQVVFTTVCGFTLGLLLHFSPLTSVYLAIAFAFSSTIIVVKFLTDKEDADSLYGRISIGFLLVQDFLAMIILLGLNAVHSGAALDQVFYRSILKAIVLIPCLWIISSKILPPILSYVAKSQELLFVFAIGWCFLIANVLSYFGFGIEIGALIAGITLSGSFYHREIQTRVRPLRDFFLIIFFIVLGTHLSFTGLSTMIVPIICFTLLILIANPLIVLVIMRLLGYHPRTGFLAGTTVAQISEFSFIIIAAGIASGQLSTTILGLVTTVALLTIAASSFIIEHNARIYERLHPLLHWLEPETILDAEMKKVHKSVHVLLFGFHRTGSTRLKIIEKLHKSFTVIDFDPVVIQHLAEHGVSAVYGDAGDENFLSEIQTDKAKLIISTIPDASVSATLLTYLRSKKFTGSVIVSVHTHEQAARCYEMGATYVIIPSALSGKKFGELLLASKGQKKTWDALRKEMHSLF